MYIVFVVYPITTQRCTQSPEVGIKTEIGIKMEINTDIYDNDWVTSGIMSALTPQVSLTTSCV